MASNKSSGKETASNKKRKPTPKSLEEDRPDLNAQILGYKNPLSFEEKQYSVQYHDIKIFIQGVDVSPFMIEDLNVETSLEGSGSLRFKLDNSGDKFTLTSDNINKWDIDSVLNGTNTFSYRTNYDKVQESLNEVNAIINKLKKGGSLTKAQKARDEQHKTDLTMLKKKYGGKNKESYNSEKEALINTEKENKKQEKHTLATYMSQRDKLTKDLNIAAIDIMAAPLSIKDVYTELPKAKIYAYKMGQMFSQVTETAGVVEDVLSVEDGRLACALGGYQPESYAAPNGTKLHYAKPQEPEYKTLVPEEIWFDLYIAPGTDQAAYITEVDKRNKFNAQVKKDYDRKIKIWNAKEKNYNSCKSSYVDVYRGVSVKLNLDEKIITYIMLVFQGLPKTVYKKANWQTTKNLIIEHVISQFLEDSIYTDPDVTSNTKANKLKAEKLFKFAYFKYRARTRYKIRDLTRVSRRTYRKLKILKQEAQKGTVVTDTATGETMWSMGIGRPIFHRNDPVRVFVHNPYVSYDVDEWLPKYTGYLKEISLEEDSITGKSLISIAANDLKGLMDRMRFQTGKSLYLPVPIIPLGDKKLTLFNDSAGQQGRNFHVFRNISISDIFDSILLGHKYTKKGGERSQGNGKLRYKKNGDAATSNSSTPVGRLKKGFTLFYPPNDSTGKPRESLEDIKVFDLEFLHYQKESLERSLEELGDVKNTLISKFKKLAETYTIQKVSSFFNKDATSDSNLAAKEKAELQKIVEDKLKERTNFLGTVSKNPTSDKTVNLYQFYKKLLDNYETYVQATSDNVSKTNKSLFTKYRQLDSAIKKEKNEKKKAKLQKQLSSLEKKLKNSGKLDSAQLLRDAAINDTYIKSIGAKYENLAKKLKRVNKKYEALKKKRGENLSDYTTFKRNLLARWHYLTLAGALPPKDELLGGQYSSNVSLTKRLLATDFGEFKARLLTEEEVDLIGFGTTTDGPWAPDNSFFHTLLPSGGSGSDLTNYKFEPGGEVKSFSTRLALLNEYTEILDYKWYVTPIGDIMMEFPFYDFYPEDFGAVENTFKINYDIINESFAEESGDVLTVLELHGGNSNKMGKGAAIEGMPKSIQPRAFVWCPILMPRLGYKQQTLQYGFIEHTSALAGLGIIKFQKALLDANKWTLNMVAREGLGLNRPIYNEKALRMGLIAGTSYSYSYEAAQTMGLTITAVKRLRSDRTFRFISGGAHMPINYGNILKAKNFKALKAYAKQQGLRIYVYTHKTYIKGLGGRNSSGKITKASKLSSAKDNIPTMKKIISNYLLYNTSNGTLQYFNLPFPKKAGSDHTSPAVAITSTMASLGGAGDCWVISAQDCADISSSAGPGSYCKYKKSISLGNTVKSHLRSTEGIIGNKKRGESYPSSVSTEATVKAFPLKTSKGQANGYLAYIILLYAKNKGGGGLSTQEAHFLEEIIAGMGQTSKKIESIRANIAQPTAPFQCLGTQKRSVTCWTVYQKMFEEFKALDAVFSKYKNTPPVKHKFLVPKACPERARLTDEPLHAMDSKGNDFFMALFTSPSVFRKTGSALYYMYQSSLKSKLAANRILIKAGLSTDVSLLQIGKVALYERNVPKVYDIVTGDAKTNYNINNNTYALMQHTVPYFGGLFTGNHFYSILYYIGKASQKDKRALYYKLGKLWWTNRLFIIKSNNNNSYMVCRAVEERSGGSKCETSENYHWAFSSPSKIKGTVEISYFLNNTKQELDTLSQPRYLATANTPSLKSDLLKLGLLYACPFDGSVNIFDRTENKLYPVKTCPFLGGTRKGAQTIPATEVSLPNNTAGAYAAVKEYFSGVPATKPLPKNKK